MFVLGAATMSRAQEVGPALGQADATRVMQDFGACFASRQPHVENLLNTVPGSADEDAIVSKAAHSDCLDGAVSSKLRFNAHALRGPIVEALLKRDFDIATGVQRKATVARTYALPDAAAPARQFMPFNAMVALVAFGQCVQKGDPTATLAVFRTKVESKQERAAMATLQPALNKCLEAGGSFRMTPFEMRGYLAEGSYRNLASGDGHG